MPGGILGRTIHVNPATIYPDGGGGFGSDVRGVQAKSFRFSAKEIDVTEHATDGWRHILPRPEHRAVEVSVNGVARKEAQPFPAYIGSGGVTVASEFHALLDAWRNSTRVYMSIYGTEGFPPSRRSVMEICGYFVMKSFEVTAEHDSAVEWSAAFSSTGQIDNFSR